MKNFKFLILSLSILATGFSMQSCADKPTKAEQTGPEYTSAYICPMHCDGSGSAEMGICPVCGMDYVANENYKGKTQSEPKSEEHDHDGSEGEGHDHDGHDHEGHNH